MSCTTRFLLSIVTLIISHISIAQKINYKKYEPVGQTIDRIRIASASVVPKKWDKAMNWERIERMVREAASEGDARVVVTPE